MSRSRIVLRDLLVAALATAAMLLLRRYVVVPWLDLRSPYLPLMAAVALSAWNAGMRAGLMATTLGAISVAVMLSRRFEAADVSPQFFLVLAIFVGVGTFLSWLIENARAARARMATRQLQLETEIAVRERAEAAARAQREQLAVEIERRAAAEIALREREERIRMAVESAAIGTWDFNPITGERTWSERTKTMFGLAPDTDVTHINFLDRIHPEDRERAQVAVEKALDPRGDGRYEIDCRLLRPDDSVGWFIVKGQAFFQGDGEQRRPARFIGTVIEITERKKTEQALRQAEERFRKLTTYAPVGIFFSDAEGRCQFVNDAWCEIAGGSADEAMGDGWTKFLHPHDRERVVAEWADAARNHRNATSEFRFLNKTTGVRWVAASVLALFDDAESVTGFVGTIVDMTDRKVIEDVIRADEARLRSILDNSPDIISLKDLEGRYVQVNRRWEELYGVSNEQILGKTNYDLLNMTRSSHMTPTIADQFAEIDRQVIASRGPVAFEDPIPDGQDQRVFATVKFPITDPNGLVTGVGGATTDITERRRALDSLKAEQELLRRTLEEQDRERQLIVYAVHDGLIQYAAGALMQLQSLELPAQNQAGRELVDSVAADLRRAVNEGRQLINGIRTPVLDDLGVVAALEQLIEEEDRAHVQVEFVKDDFLERIDPKAEEALFRIAQEALTNIRKHSQAKRVRVEVTRRGDLVHLEVRDWGVGFTTNNNAHGTHGLQSMAERARFAGGHFQLKSAPGEGTQVMVDLPFVPRF
ncbi:MAG TPA: PAS domain S-box protein [Pirellulales bacterium]|nr:PAS domain S-box protein [Pirellulales bacterium]